MRHLLIVLAGLAVAVIWLASAVANYLYGTSYGATPEQAAVFGGVSVASDLLKAGLAFAIAAAFVMRRWVAMTVAMVLFACCTIWSLNSAIGFATTNIFQAVQPNLIKEHRTKLELKSIDAT